MRSLLKLLLVGAILAAIVAAALALTPRSPGEEKFVLLRPGSSARAIAAELEANGVIRSRHAFLLTHVLKGSPTLKAGEYRFADAATAEQVHARIARGDIFVHTVTIPEGYNIFDIAAALEAARLGLGKDAWLNLLRTEVELISDVDPQAQSLEGYLFPDTYHFTRTQQPREMVAMMVRRFRQEAQALGLTQDFHRIVTMASIVEKETSVPTERPLVAGVFYNRLRLNTVLATDPAVIYAALLAGRYDGVIHRSDLDFDSPYNTYKYAGLPPGPIANPGRESLRAAMHPQQTDYLYFVSDANGAHRFSRTLEEHSRNVAAYRRAQGAR